jgi:hypothetical protein
MAPAPSIPAPQDAVRRLATRRSHGNLTPHITRCTIEELRRDNILWYKLHVFMYDLRNFGSNKDARDRLDSIASEHYIGEPYFDTAEADKLLHTVTSTATGSTLGDAIEQFFTEKLALRLKGRMEETGDYRVCAAHDLAPLFERAFRINAKDLVMNKSFMTLARKGGLYALDQGGVWKGLGKR